MNVKLKTIIISVICTIVLIIISVLTGTTIYYKHQYNKSVERYRQLVDESRKRNEQYEATFRAARATNNDIGECLSRCEYSLSELRDALYVIRERYTEMENLLNSFGGSYDFDGRSFDSTDNTACIEIEDNKCTTSTE